MQIRLRNTILGIGICVMVGSIFFFSTTIFVKKEFVGYKKFALDDFLSTSINVSDEDGNFFAEIRPHTSCFLWTGVDSSLNVIYSFVPKSVYIGDHPIIIVARRSKNEYIIISNIPEPQKIYNWEGLVVNKNTSAIELLTDVLSCTYARSFRKGFVDLIQNQRTQNEKLYDTKSIITAPLIISLTLFLFLWYGILLYYDKRRLRWRPQFGYPKGAWGLLYRIYLPQSHEENFKAHGINNLIQLLQVPKGNGQEKLIRKAFEIVDTPRGLNDFWLALKHIGKDWKLTKIIEQDIEKSSKQFILEYLAEGSFSKEEKKQEYNIKYFWKVVGLKPGQRKKYFMNLEIIPAEQLNGKRIADVLAWKVSQQVEIKYKKDNQTIDYGCLALSEVGKLRGDKILLKRFSERIKETKEKKEIKDTWNFVLYLKGKSYTAINNYINIYLRNGVSVAIDSVVNETESAEIVAEEVISQEEILPKISKKLGRVLVLGNGIDVYKIQYAQMLKEYGATETIFYTGDLFEQKTASAMPQIETAIIIAKRISHSAAYKCKNMYGNENVLEISVLNHERFAAYLAENGY